MSQSAYNLFAQLQDLVQSSNETVTLDTVARNFAKLGYSLSTEDIGFLKQFNDRIPIQFLLFKERVKPLTLDRHSELNQSHLERNRNYYESFYNPNRYGRIKQLPLTYQTLLPNLETNTVYAKNNDIHAAIIDEYNTFSQIKKADDIRWQTTYNKEGISQPFITLNPKEKKIIPKEIDFQQSLYDNAIIEMFDVVEIDNLDGKSTLELKPKDKTSPISHILIYNVYDNFKPTKGFIFKRDGSSEEMILPLADKFQRILVGQRKSQYKDIPSYDPLSLRIPLYESNIITQLNQNKIESARELPDDELINMINTGVYKQNNFIPNEEKGLVDLNKQQQIIQSNTQDKLDNLLEILQEEEKQADIRWQNTQLINTFNFLKDRNPKLRETLNFIKLNTNIQDQALSNHLNAQLTDMIQRQDPAYWYEYINNNIPVLKYKNF